MNKLTLTPEQDKAMKIARLRLMNDCPFFSHYFYSELEEFPTKELGMPAGTDGKRVFYDPDFMMSLKPGERVFILAHETYHAIMRHPVRMKHYGNEGHLRGLQWSPELFNIAADFIINADLIAQKIGQRPEIGCFDDSVKGDEMVEDLYEKLYKKNPPPPPPPQPGSGADGEDGKSGQLPGKPSGKPGNGKQPQGKQPSPSSNTGFDKVIPPQVDPVTGREDIASEGEYKEALARAAAAAKAIDKGKFPAHWQRMIDELLTPQIDWKEHIRMLITGKIGSRHETWERPNRRRLALSGGDATRMIILPGRRGYGARDVAVAIDTSGSIGEKELAAFFAEVGGILADVRPKNIHLIWCDAKVHRVDRCSSLDELAHIRAKGAPGGGGTSFKPPFEYLAENDIRPEAMVYLTDLYGDFPKAPAYPVIWASISDETAPFGETVRIKL